MGVNSSRRSVYFMSLTSPTIWYSSFGLPDCWATPNVLPIGLAPLKY